MKTLIIYTNRCLRCSERRRWNNLRRYCKSRSLILEERRTDRSKKWQEEAEHYGLDYPFIVNGTQALDFNEPLERLEE